MKHSDYQAKVNELKALEYEELKRSIEAHGGSYEWDSENGGSYPIIAINSNKSEPEPQDIEITKVAIVDGQLKISGVDNKYGEPVKFDADDIFAGHLSLSLTTFRQRMRFLMCPNPKLSRIYLICEAQQEPPTLPCDGTLKAPVRKK